MPKHLGEDSAPIVQVGLGARTPYGGLVGLHDELSGMGDFCVELRLGPAGVSSLKTLDPPPATSLRLDPRGSVAVHLLESPLFGCGGVRVRLDGARCHTAPVLFGTQGPPEGEGPKPGGLKDGLRGPRGDLKDLLSGPP